MGPIEWFIKDPLDVMFTFGLGGFAATGVYNCINKKARIPRVVSAYGAIVTACFIVGNLKLGLPVSIISNIVSTIAWAYIFFKRHTGVESDAK